MTRQADSGALTCTRLFPCIFTKDFRQRHQPKKRTTMKIDTDLRIAIRSAVKLHNATKCDWNAYREDQVKAIEAVAAKPRNKKMIAKARAQMALAKELREKASEVFNALGINGDLDRVDDVDLFKKAGGVMVTKNKAIDPETILGRLATADSKEGARIIKELGIKWS